MTPCHSLLGWVENFSPLFVALSIVHWKLERGQELIANVLTNDGNLALKTE